MKASMVILLLILITACNNRILRIGVTESLSDEITDILISNNANNPDTIAYLIRPDQAANLLQNGAVNVVCSEAMVRGNSDQKLIRLIVQDHKDTQALTVTFPLDLSGYVRSYGDSVIYCKRLEWLILQLHPEARRAETELNDMIRTRVKEVRWFGRRILENTE
jgi:hypothetical protein